MNIPILRQNVLYFLRLNRNSFKVEVGYVYDTDITVNTPVISHVCV